MNTLRLQELIGRSVRDAAGKRLGHVSDVIAEGEGGELRVIAVVVGAAGLLTRFGWTRRMHGLAIPWERIAQLSPEIVLHPEPRGGG
jgi:sporulation protein YlmC with PRC-barrel domain